MIYGTPALKILSDQTDRIGIRNLQVGIMWQASRWPLTLEELDGEAPSAPAPPSGMEIISRATQPMAGGLRTSFTFSGVHGLGNGKDVPFKTRSNSPDYQFTQGFSQVDIALHPNIKALMAAYGGQSADGQIIWQPTIDAGAARGSDALNVFSDGGGDPNSFATFAAGVTSPLGLAGSSSGTVKNPMFGVSDFLRGEGTYTFRYASVTLSGIDTNVGAILVAGGLPGRAPAHTGRDYLKQPSAFQRHGPVYAITEIYWLSGRGGWPKPVYGVASQR